MGVYIGVPYFGETTICCGLVFWSVQASIPDQAVGEIAADMIDSMMPRSCNFWLMALGWVLPHPVTVDIRGPIKGYIPKL